MKLILAIVKDIDASAVVSGLVERSYRVTRIASTGGFLRQGNATLVIGVDADQVDSVIDLMREVCSPPEAGQHRATLFILDAAGFVQV